MDKAKLLDLFCCEGGAGMGYARAGFEVTGVDILKRPRYPFAFIQADALALDLDFLRQFDAIHASPPCQFATLLKHAPNGKEHENLIPQTRAMLEASGRPYVIENVEPASPFLVRPQLLCGTMFGLETEGFELQRHRRFETNWPLTVPICQHSGRPVVGVYGGHARNRSKAHGGRGTRDVWEKGHKGAASEAMGMDWATLGGMSEAIPPAYTEFIGRQLLDQIQQRKAA